MTISLLEPLGIHKELLESFAKEMQGAGHRFTAHDTKASSVEELIQRSQGQEIIMIANTPYPREVIAANPQIKMIAVAFTGVDHVDLAACKEAGIVVTNCAGYSDQAVAEHVLGLTLAHLRKIVAGDRATRSGKGSAGLMGSEIAGKTVGIIGYGRIGSQAARLFAAFGARVLAWSRTEKRDSTVTFTSLEELLRESDIVSLHLPSTKETHHLMGREELSLLKEGALFINCARGPIVDTEALAALLAEGRISASLDVFDSEPPLATEYPLLTTPNTLLTPHVAYLTEEAMVRRAVIEFENVRSFLTGNVQNQVRL